ncbi:DUF4232 domain-containing protein [Curtobacterium ammoniigenes]|uniref:DUF4232 domain-containing protein n=1 Tax=Curtobacterium ammoniigenes TaxID=395387 RepID=UPI0008373892|nr:DUF4232 domain-containing protein [Curtobacterium ammoniigenes]
MTDRNRISFALALGVVAAATLAGCASSATAPTAGGSSAAASSSMSPSSSASASDSSTPSASATDGQGGDTGGSVSGTLCSTTELTGGTEPGSGGAAGSTIIHLTFKNTGSTTCVLQGWPGVSFVGDGNGTQLGAPATLDRAAPHPTVTLAPGATAVAPLKIAQAGNYPSASCTPTPADGFRVYPPGSTTALYIKASGYTACASTAAPLLDVQAVVAQGQATD